MAAAIAAAEAQILTSFLLSRAGFTDIIDYNTFRALFPKQFQDHPQVKYLYNHLAIKRAAILETVRDNIAFETKISHQLLRRRQQEAAAQEEKERESILQHTGKINSVTEVYGDVSTMGTKRLSPQSMVQLLQEAHEAMENDAKVLDEDCEKLQIEIRDIVGGLSRLKMGTLGRDGLVDSVIQDLELLQKTCDRVLEAD